MDADADADAGRWLRGHWPVEAVAVWSLLSAFGVRTCDLLPTATLYERLSGLVSKIFPGTIHCSVCGSCNVT